MKKEGKMITFLLADDDPDDRQLTRDAFAENRLANELHCVEDGEELMDYAGSYTLTINGRGFGIWPRQILPLRGDTLFFRIAIAAQIGFGEWGFSGDAKALVYESWSDTQVQIAGFVAQPGDAIQIALWNPTSGDGQNLHMLVKGKGFGNAPVTMPNTGDLNQFSFGDFRTHCGGNSSLFEAGARR